MMRLFGILSFVCVLVSCGKKDKNEDVLPQPRMERVLWDIVQADEFIQAYVLKDSAKVDVKAERLKQYEKVFRLHNITREQFVKSYDYYLSHPSKNKVLFDSLAAKANRRMQDAYKNMNVP